MAEAVWKPYLQGDAGCTAALAGPVWIMNPMQLDQDSLWFGQMLHAQRKLLNQSWLRSNAS
jgi:hypothetical protein